MKTRDDIYELIEQLNVTIQMLEDQYDIDQGGCVLTSWVIARNLHERHLNYKVVIYAYPDSTTKDVRTLLKNEQLCHMCIQTYKQEIGGIDDELVKEHGVKKFTTDLTPDEIRQLWEKSSFNDKFSKNSEQDVVNEIDMAFDMLW